MSDDINKDNDNHQPIYDASSIGIEEGAKVHRTRPAQFLGSAEAKGIENQAFEIIDNAIDEVMEYNHIATSGGTRRDMIHNNPIITIDIKKDGSITVIDRGRGMPTDIHPEKKVPAVYLICESSSAGAKGRGTEGYSSGTSGIHGSGMAVANSCAEYFNLTINSLSGKGRYSLSYKEGERQGELVRIGDLELDENELPYTGTRIDMKYDSKVLRTQRNGLPTTEVLEPVFVRRRLEEILLGRRTNIALHVTHEDSKGEILEYVIDENTQSPEKFLETDHPIHYKFSQNSNQDILDTTGQHTGFSAEVYISMGDINQSTLSRTQTMVNRLRMDKMRTDIIVLEVVTRVLDNIMINDSKLDPEVRANGVSKDLVSPHLSSLVLLELPMPEYSGQTKTNLVTTSFIQGFSNSLDQAIRDDKQNLLKLYAPIRYKAIQVHEQTLLRRKMEEQRRKEEKKREKKEESNSRMNKLLNDPLELEFESENAPIKILDSPFPNSMSTIVWVEGKSAGTAFQFLHAKGEQPIAIAAITGKAPNLTKDAPDTEMTMYNRALCLEKGYQNLAILTDGDTDGAHIRALLIYQIIKYAPQYLRDGKVFIIPAAHGKVYLPEPMMIEMMGEIAIYEKGEQYTFSSKEHQALVSAGASSLIRYTGLMASALPAVELVKDKSLWEPVKPPTREELMIIESLLQGSSKFKSVYTSDVFTSRLFHSKHVDKPGNRIRLSGEDLDRAHRHDNLSTTPTILDYVDNIAEKFNKDNSSMNLGENRYGR